MATIIANFHFLFVNRKKRYTFANYLNLLWRMAIFKIDINNKFNVFSKEFWVKIVIMTIAIWITSFTGLVEHNDGPLYALLAAVIISILNAFLRPLLSLISMPLMIASFGIFMLVINALIILLTSFLLDPHFIIQGFGNAFFFSIVVTFLTFLMNLPRKIRKLQNNMFQNKEKQDFYEKNTDEKTIKDNNPNSSNRFDDNPFNDNPQDKNYTDFEDIN